MSDVGGPGAPGGPRPPPSTQPQPSGGQSQPQGGNAGKPAQAPSAPPGQPQPSSPPSTQSQPQPPAQPATTQGQSSAAGQSAPQPQPAPPASGSANAGGTAAPATADTGKSPAPSQTATAAPRPADSIAPGILRAAAEAAQTRPAAPATLPDAIARLPAGQSFEAVVVGKTEAGATVIDTAGGRVAAFTASNLPPGARITVVIAAAPPVPGSAATASIVAVDGQPLPAARFAVLAGLGGSGQAPLIQQASPQAQPAPLPAGSVIVASLLGRPTVAALNALPGPLAAGTPTALRVLSIAPPALSAIPGTPVQANAAALAGTQSIAAGAGTGAREVSGGATAPTPGASTPAPGVIPQTAAAPASTAPAGTGAPTPVLGSAPPTGPGAAPVLAALVVGQDGNGQTLVRANGMVLTLADRTPLPLGTTLRLEVLPRPEQAPPPLAGATAVRTDPVLALSHSWPALNEIVEVLRQASPAVANQFLGTAIPAANGQLLANVMTFLFGVQIANPRNWLGPQVVQALERAGRGDLVRRLGDDFGRVSRLAQEPGGGDWRTFLIPFLDGEHLQQIRMYLRDHRGEAEEGREEPGQRMIVDLDLTRLGAMQLDGLFRERGFDLLIRTHTPLSEEARRDIGTIFDNTMRDTGLKGTLGFHVMRTFPVRPLEDVAGKGGQGVVA